MRTFWKLTREVSSDAGWRHYATDFVIFRLSQFPDIRGPIRHTSRTVIEPAANDSLTHSRGGNPNGSPQCVPPSEVHDHPAHLRVIFDDARFTRRCGKPPRWRTLSVRLHVDRCPTGPVR